MQFGECRCAESCFVSPYLLNKINESFVILICLNFPESSLSTKQPVGRGSLVISIVFSEPCTQNIEFFLLFLLDFPDATAAALAGSAAAVAAINAAKSASESLTSGDDVTVESGTDGTAIFAGAAAAAAGRVNGANAALSALADGADLVVLRFDRDLASADDEDDEDEEDGPAYGTEGGGAGRSAATRLMTRPLASTQSISSATSPSASRIR